MNRRAGTRLAAFSREFVPTHGLCMSCGAVMDDSGCRVLRVAELCEGDTSPSRPDLRPDQQELRELLLRHPVYAEIECAAEFHRDEQRAWAEHGGKVRSGP